MSPRRVGLLLCSVAAHAGCAGTLESGQDPAGEGPGSPPGQSATAPPGGKAPGSSLPGATPPGPGQPGAGQVPVGVMPPAGSGKVYAPLKPVEGSMWRLTQRQLRNSIADVFGADVRVLSPLDSDEMTETFLSMGAAKVGTSERGVEQYRDAAFEIAAQVFKKRAMIPELSACAPQRSTDACVGAFIRSIGLRLWRRPLADDEVARYVKIVAAEGETPDKVGKNLEWALVGLLQSPNFMYLVQAGEKDPQQGVLRFSSWEMASRLSYLLWDSTPDAELLMAAQKGELVTREGIAVQVKRMLGRPRARALPARFLGESWRVHKLDADSKNPKAYPLWTAALLNAYREELTRVLDEAVFGRGADLRELFDLRETFANKEMAKVYGMTSLTSTDFVKVPLDANRAGVLTLGAVIAANSPADRSSPTYRGVWIRERVLCQEVPAPPENVDNSLNKPPAAGQKPRTLREQLEQHRQDPACAGCHAFIDPLGLTFENFDAIGVYRANENGLPVDANGELDGRKFRGARELALALKDEPRAMSCLAHELYAFATGHEATEGEKGVVEALQDQFVSAKHAFVPLVTEVVTSGGFRFLAAP